MPNIFFCIYHFRIFFPTCSPFSCARSKCPCYSGFCHAEGVRELGIAQRREHTIVLLLQLQVGLPLAVRIQELSLAQQVSLHTFENKTNMKLLSENRHENASICSSLAWDENFLCFLNERKSMPDQMNWAKLLLIPWRFCGVLVHLCYMLFLFSVFKWVSNFWVQWSEFCHFSVMNCFGLFIPVILPLDQFKGSTLH